MRSAGWVCVQFILEFSHSPVFMDRTDTVYLYVCIQYFVGAWLALRMPPPFVLSKPSGAESQVFKTESVSELFIYIYINIHIVVYLSKRIAHKSYWILYINIYIYIYISIYLTISICVYVSMQVSYIENLQGLPKAPAKQDSEALECAKKEANTVEDSTDDM